MNIRYLILALTSRCNLSCRYCYHGDSAIPMDMSYDVLQKALDLASQGDGPLHIQITGGEPTLAENLVHFAVRQASMINRPHTIGIQTNGTNLSEPLIRFLKAHQVQICVSLDGPPDVQQQLRGKAAATLRGMQLLELCEAPFRVTTVLSAANLPHLPRTALMLAGFSQARGIGLDLLVKKGTARESAVSHPEAEELRHSVAKLVGVLDSVNVKRKIPLQLRELDLLKDALSKPSVNGGKPFCHACRGESMAVAPDGRISLCGQTLRDSDFNAGTVLNPNFERLTAFSGQALTSKMCGQCPLQGRCPGECPSRMYYNSSDEPALVCNLYLGLLSTINSKMS